MTALDKISQIKISQIFYLPAFLCFFLITCKEKTAPPRLTVFTANPALHFSNGSLLYNNTPFTGTTEEKYPSGILKTHAEYTGGKENGYTKTFYEDGEKESARYYTNGRKDSIAIGYYTGGAKKFEYHFKDDLYNGAFTEWYPGGQMSQQIMYAVGKELSGQGWRENGKLYMNFVWKGNRRYGLVNPNMCYGIEKGAIRE